MNKSVQREIYNIFDGELQIIVFKVQDCSQKEYLYGLNTQKVQSIVELGNYTALPNSENGVIGIFESHNVLVPIVDLSQYILKTPTLQIGKFPPRIIICRVFKKLIGLLIPQTLPAIRIANKDMLPPPQEAFSKQKAPVNGVFKFNEKFVYMLDLESIISELRGNTDDLKDQKISEIEMLKGKKILIAEDSKVVRKQLENFFKHSGAEITLMEDGQSAFDELMKANNKYDLLFTDIEMPRLNGIQLARKIKMLPQFVDLPIVFNSSISNEILINEIEKEQLGRYIVKFNAQEIESCLLDVFRSVQGFEIW